MDYATAVAIAVSAIHMNYTPVQPKPDRFDSCISSIYRVEGVPNGWLSTVECPVEVKTAQNTICQPTPYGTRCSTDPGKPRPYLGAISGYGSPATPPPQKGKNCFSECNPITHVCTRNCF
jgi:hypothetical protein